MLPSIRQTHNHHGVLNPVDWLQEHLVSLPAGQLHADNEDTALQN